MSTCSTRRSDASFWEGDRELALAGPSHAELDASLGDVAAERYVIATFAVPHARVGVEQNCPAGPACRSARIPPARRPASRGRAEPLSAYRNDDGRSRN